MATIKLGAAFQPQPPTPAPNDAVARALQAVGDALASLGAPGLAVPRPAPMDPSRPDPAIVQRMQAKSARFLADALLEMENLQLSLIGDFPARDWAQGLKDALDVVAATAGRDREAVTRAARLLLGRPASVGDNAKYAQVLNLFGSWSAQEAHLARYASAIPGVSPVVRAWVGRMQSRGVPVG